MLDKRLFAIASYVRKNSYVCDVGTDHAYLPCYLVKEGITQKCVACDINEMPLENAKQHIKEYGLENQIETILSDGLTNVPSHKAEDIIIAGMGGELIATILQGVDYTKDKSKRFILQPMTFVSFLREFLCKNGYEILEETPIIDGDKTYTVMSVQYTGTITEPTELFLTVGKIPNHHSDEARIYIERQLQKQLRIAQSLEKSATQFEKSKQHYALASQLQQLLNEL
jgi:tRNA (adenine22-N1)-methyltransferase